MTQNRLSSLHHFIRHLVTAIANASLYSLQHQQVSRLAKMSLDSLHDAIGTDLDISLMMIDSDIIVDARQLDNSLYIARLAQALKSLGISHIKFIHGVTQEEILAFIRLLLAKEASVEILSTEHIHFGTVEIRFSQSGQDEEKTKEAPIDITDMAAEEAARFAEIYEEVRRHKRLRVNGIFELVSGFINAFKQVSDPLMAFAPLRALDEYTFTHSTNVCILNLAQAMSLGIDSPLLQEIGIAAMLHDMGKLFIPEAILTKPDVLDEREWELMRQHPVKGAQYLLDAPGVPRLAVVTAFEHHLKFDLSGYPAVSPGWQQNLCSQMTTISDAFDALRTRRVYQGAVELESIKTIMTSQIGITLHPALTRNFLNLIDKMTFHNEKTTLGREADQ